MESYAVVFRDHDGGWHAVLHVWDWASARIGFDTLVLTLGAVDYYADFPPTVAKIVSAKGAGNDYYASAPALAGPLSRE